MAIFKPFRGNGDNLDKVEKHAGHAYFCTDSAEFFIDNCVPKGDATVEIGDSKMGAVSTAASCFIVNSVLVGAAGLAKEAGKKPPVYKSGNVEGGAEFNKALIDAYRSRIKHL